MTASTAELLVVCTGNAARSVMAGYMLEVLLADAGTRVGITTAGTHALEGQPVSQRTRGALKTVPALAESAVGRHRSRSLMEDDVERADLVIAMEADHVRFVRRHHPAAAPRTATLRRLVADLAPPGGPLEERIAALGLARVELSADEDVADPAGGGQADYDACAAELWRLCGQLAERI